jgi:hypothetical protein
MHGCALGQWREAASYAPVLAGGRSALAWELLRRDPEYCAEAAGRDSTRAIVAPWNNASVLRWGLHFPV